jgi:hypothetical protein
VKIHFCHGIHTSFDNPTVEALVPYLEKTGIQVMNPRYGAIASFETPRINPIVVGMMKPYVETGDILLGHSNGAEIIYDLAHELAKQSVIPLGLIFINAALEQRITVPAGIGWFTALYNEDDTITEVAAIAAWLGTAPRTWGQMGHGGYIGTDPRGENVDCKHTAGEPPVMGHSDLFTPAKLPSWGDWFFHYIVRKISEGAPQ